jgi:2-polyprenyl-3-methyl-5-hydroxy-6-metoxy-1,4-benzoquinol methylase
VGRRSDRYDDALACRLCGGPSEPAFSVGDRNRGLGSGSFAYRRCATCRSVVLHTIPDDLGDYYASDGYGSAAAAEVPEFLRREQDKLELVTRFAEVGTMVEIGPGPGMFTRVARSAGFEITAIEMDPEYARRLREDLAVEAICSDDPAEVLASLQPSSVVVMWHVIEHLPDPWRVLAACARNLRPGGVLAISTPNPQSLQFRLLGRYWAHLDAPRHLQLLPAATLQARAEALGMRRVLSTTTDVVGLECNRLGWEYALRAHPARRPTTAASMRGSFLLTRALSGVERRGLAGTTYTSLFTKATLGG